MITCLHCRADLEASTHAPDCRGRFIADRLLPERRRSFDVLSRFAEWTTERGPA